MGNIWKDKRRCRGGPERYRIFEMSTDEEIWQFRRMNNCIEFIKRYGQRYGQYFAPEFVVHTRRHGNPFEVTSSAQTLFPSGVTFNGYLYEREQMVRNNTNDDDDECVIDLRSEHDEDDDDDDNMSLSL